MTDNEMKAFIGFQQGELDAVEMYKKLAQLTKSDKLREAFLDAVKDEGRHAAIMYKLTGTQLTPDSKLANIIEKAYKVAPKRILLQGVALGEQFGGNGYRPYIADYPELESIMFDEYKHRDIMRKLSKEK